MPRVVISGHIQDVGRTILSAYPGLEIDQLPDEDPETLRRPLPGADALLTRTGLLPPALLRETNGLKVVSRHGVGYDNIPVDALTARGIPLALAIGANAVSVAEQVLAFAFALAKRMPALDRAVRAGDWGARNRLGPFELGGRRLLILGFGRIGRQISSRARALGMSVAAFDPLVPAEAIRAAGAEPVDDWRAILPEVDVISLHVPRTPETENMIGAAELDRMRPDAILINTARGGLIDEAALAAALAAGKLAGAGIDTLDDEPPKPDNPLLRSDRVILSPHTAGLSREGHANLSRISAENVVAALDGRLDPSVVVNPSVLSR
ncbi:MAG TPA: hydroxyacid dehydrogenase [Bauldia sp.]|nr:hydroxyacid dehydrogenase [Bauldia sp.]